MLRDLFSAARDLRPDLDAVDWASTPLGPVDRWSPTLRNAVDLMLHSRFPMTLLWGPDFVMVYNDAYVQMIGDKHPAALGAPAREVFAEAWSQIGPMMQGVADTGVAHQQDDALVPLQRQGFLEDCYFTFSYSAVRGPEGIVEGVIDVAAETTRSVKGQRRVELLARLSETLAGITSTDEVVTQSLAVLSSYSDDLDAVDLRLPGSGPSDRSGDLPASVPSAVGASTLLIDEAMVARTLWAVVEPATVDAAASILVARLSPRVVIDDDLRDSLRVTAVVIGRALGRVRVEEAARVHRDLERQLSETLQRSLLTHPAQIDGLQVAVRYVPAAMEAQIGGDWYDSFVLPGGGLSLVVGDVTGHDRDAAAQMAQLRNLLRGVSMTLVDTPASILSSLERALESLAMEVIATGILAHVEPSPRGGGHRSVRWSNAGHPAPVLMASGGRAEVLHRTPDPLLGLAAFERHDHTIELSPGSTLVLYTDGLMERRGMLLDDGFAWLQSVLDQQHDLDAEAVCDLLIDRMLPGVEDDVALLVLRVPA